jgi:predicted HD superfamily hydrolase involved in NAD metabolism
MKPPRAPLRFDVSRHPLRRHLEGVSRLAARLARLNGGDSRAAAVAGLLHDWLKPLSPSALERLMAALGGTFDRETGRIPAIWHGPVAAVLAGRDMGVTDIPTLDAIRWHATGHPGFGVTGMAVFVADYCEEGRGFPEAAEGRRLALRNLRAGARYVSASKGAWLASAGARPHPISMAFNHSLLPAGLAEGGRRG